MVLNETGILRRFNLVIYPIDFVVAIGDVETDVNNYFAPNDENANWLIAPGKGVPGSTYLVHTEDKQLCVMVWIRSLDDCRGSVFAHECGHAALEIFRYVGAKADFDNQEPYCYLLGNLFRLLNGAFYELRDYKPKNKSKKK